MDKNELYEAVKIPYTSYQPFAGDDNKGFKNPYAGVVFWYDPAVNQLLMNVNFQTSAEELKRYGEWYSYANVILPSKRTCWGGETYPDMFLFNYHLHRPLTENDYSKIKEKHSKIIISLPYHTRKNCPAWNPDRINDCTDSHKVLDQIPPEKKERHDYKRGLLKVIPDFLWETDCTFIISEHHELTGITLYYEILWMIHDLEEKKGVNPERFILSDCNTAFGEDCRLQMFYEYFPFLKKRVRSIGLDRFEALTSIYYSGYYSGIKLGLGRVPGELNYDLTKKRKKKFLFLNRCGRSHRNALIAKINNDDFLFTGDNFYFSYGESKYFKKGDMIKAILEECSSEKFKELMDRLPCFLDTPKIEVKYGNDVHSKSKRKTADDPWYYGPTGDTFKILDFVKNSYFNLINETDSSFYYLFLTEKTFKCFAWKQPFIIWGNPHSLRRLHELGYQTFHPWIDESYDDIMDAHLRLEAIYKEVKKICEMDLKEVHNLYQELIPIIEYNYTHFNYQKIITRNYDYTIKKFLPRKASV